MGIAIGKIAKALAITTLRAANSGSIPILDKALDSAGAKGIGTILRENSAKSKAMKANLGATAKVNNAISAEERKLSDIKREYINLMTVLVIGYSSIPTSELTTQQVFKPRGYITRKISPNISSQKFCRIKPGTPSANNLNSQLTEYYKELNNFQNEYDKSHRILLSLESKLKALNNTLIGLQRRP